MFYLRQLSVNVFCMSDIKQDKVELLIYHEGLWANDMCSFLLKFLKDAPSQFTELCLYSDNCWGQNKNHALACLLTALIEITKIYKN